MPFTARKIRKLTARVKSDFCVSNQLVYTVLSTQWRAKEGGIPPLIHTLDNSWRWVVNLTSRERKRYTLNRRLGRSQSWSGPFAKEKDQLNLLKFQPWQSSTWHSCRLIYGANTASQRNITNKGFTRTIPLNLFHNTGTLSVSSRWGKCSLRIFQCVSLYQGFRSAYGPLTVSSRSTEGQEKYLPVYKCICSYKL